MSCVVPKSNMYSQRRRIGRRHKKQFVCKKNSSDVTPMMEQHKLCKLGEGPHQQAADFIRGIAEGCKLSLTQSVGKHNFQEHLVQKCDNYTSKENNNKKH